MKKTIIICNTYFQLIAAIQMKLTIKADEYVILILTDHSKNAESAAQNLRRISLFEEVVFFASRAVDCRDQYKSCSTFQHIKHLLWSIHGKAIFPEMELFVDADELIYYNKSVICLNLFSLQKKASDLQCSSLEEGIFSYGSIPQKGGIRSVIIELLRNVIMKPTLSACTSRVYCFYPDIYPGALLPVSIPLLSTSEKITTALRSVFPISDAQGTYKEKYIMLTSVYDFEGGSPIGEFELVQKVAEIVGGENLLVKLHPRDFRTVYEDAGFHVDRNSNYPWEVVQLSMDFSDKVLLTVNSGSALSVSMVTEKGPKVFYLYPFCQMDGNEAMKKTVKNIQAILTNPQMEKRLARVTVPAALEEILEGDNANE